MRLKKNTFIGIFIELSLFVLFAGLSGCGPVPQQIDATYGLVRGQSVNGTGAFAEMLRDRGHKVVVSRRLTDELKESADAIVRFAPFPGPPERAEAVWYDAWLQEKPSRSLIYVPRDFDAEAEYWEDVLANLPKDYDLKNRSLMELHARIAADWPRGYPSRPKLPPIPDNGSKSRSEKSLDMQGIGRRLDFGGRYQGDEIDASSTVGIHRRVSAFDLLR